ncbi:tRNA (adenine(22)-N(1))-methyltransferase [Agathobacter sp.]|uniref:tRNA (adenine(22)-N(1))-methyltransferase n=1 Tax=Agathobacter sp. TaxID=2021311 RepID=UPI0025881677|nr:class I SAM-dependent methyltransferase [Agathobacter sp.]
MIKLSKRMEAVAAMVTPGYKICDVGTDHAYIPIYLVQSGANPSALAMDLREGPLSRADEHIRDYHLEDRIATRLSDGIEALQDGEADSLIIAGMGGEVVLHILKAFPEKCRHFKEMILQPQSDVDKVRRYLRENDFKIVDEDMILEDGKYYPMFKVVPLSCGESWQKMKENARIVCDLYGPLLLRNGNPVLRKFLVKENKILRSIQVGLETQTQTESIAIRLKEVELQLAYNEAAYSIMGEIINAGISD